MSDTGTALVERIVREAISSEMGKDREHIEALESRLEQVESQLVLQVSLLLQIVEAIKNNKPTLDKPDYLEFLRKSTVPTPAYAPPPAGWPKGWGGPSSSGVLTIPKNSLSAGGINLGERIAGRQIEAIDFDSASQNYLVKLSDT